MNLFFKSYNKFLFFFLLITVPAPVLLSRSTDSALCFSPIVQTVQTPFQPDNQPFLSFFVDKRGVVYLGKENVLYVISGEKTHQFNLNGPVFVSGNKNDTVFYASVNDFGVISSDPERNTSLNSMNHPDDSCYLRIYPEGLCATAYGLFIYENRMIHLIKNNRIIHFSFDHPIKNLYYENKQLFLQTLNKDLFCWNGENFSRLVFSSLLPEDIIISINSDEKKLSVIFSSGLKWNYELADGFYTFQNKEHVSSPGLTAMNLFTDKFNCTIVRGEGLRMTDPADRTIFRLGPDNGFSFNDLIACQEDDDSNLWLLFSHGLYRVGNPALFSVIEFQKKYPGRINAMLVHNQQIYLSGNSGIFSLSLAGEHPQPLMKTISESATDNLYLLGSNGESVFAAGNEHLYEITDQKLSEIDTGFFYQLLVLSDDSVLVSCKDGIIFYNRISGSRKWISLSIDPSFHSIHSLHYLNHSIWFVADEKKIIRIRDNFNYSSPEIVYKTQNTLSLQQSGKDLFIISDDSLYRIDAQTGTVYPVNNLFDASLLRNSKLSISDTDSILWIIADHAEKPVLWSLTRSIKKSQVYPFVSEFNEITGLGSSGDYLWISDRHNLYRLNRKLLQNKTDFLPALEINQGHKPVVLTDTVSGNLFNPRKAKPDIYLKYKDKDFTISVMPEDNICGSNYYIRYRILPVEKEWSEWVPQKPLNIKNLKSGKYLFQIQRTNQFGQVSSPSSFILQIRVQVFRYWISYIFYFLILIILVFLINKWRLISIHKIESKAEEKVKDQIDELVREKEKSDKLVADMFPKTTADELKASGRAKWDKYEMATVLFSDIQGFTKIAEHMNPEMLIDELDKFFFHFDSVVEKYNIEKIKTIGDAYMAAGGIPEKNSTNPVEVVLAALEMQHYMHELKKTNADIWDLRIGIHTGPVIAGVVGHKKLSYDIWGDTVNTASRMESSGVAGKVNISGTTYSLVKNYFVCEYRGKLPVKYKGNIDMYFVNGLRPELTVDLAGIPNKRFFILLQTLRLNDLEAKVFDAYYQYFDEKFRFHNMNYIHRFLEQIRLLCRAEELDEEDTLICLTTGLVLYSGLSQNYENFENRSVVIARELLPSFHYNDKQIDLISHTLIGTKYPPEPRNILEKIVIDARMEYLGRPDLPSIIKEMYAEAKENGSKLDFSSWKEKQISVLQSFNFYTLASRRLREVQAPEQIMAIEKET